MATSKRALDQMLRNQNFEDRKSAYADATTEGMPLSERYKIYMDKTYGHSDSRLND